MMENLSSDALKILSMNRGKCREYWISSRENHSEGIGIVSRAAEFLNAHDAVAVSTFLFGNAAELAAASRLFADGTRKPSCPPLLLQNNAGVKIQVHAVAGVKSEAIYFNDELIGEEFTDADIRCLMLKVLPDETAADEYCQAANLFEKTRRILECCGATFSDTVRTWLYARNILSWYAQLNRARNQFFEQHGIYAGLPPASTGIGLDNAAGSALAAQILAVIPLHRQVSVQRAHSPLQCPALVYNSAFSRGVKIQSPEQRRLYISGTASIDKTGQTAFADDTGAQIAMSMRVVLAMLRDAGMDWSATVSALAYFKDKNDFPQFDAYCRRHDLDLPHVKVQADICRADLRFEIELEAIIHSV